LGAADFPPDRSPHNLNDLAGSELVQPGPDGFFAAGRVMKYIT